MKLEKVLVELKKMKAYENGDVSIAKYGDEIEVVVNDFGGFDENWSEILLSYDEDAVDEMAEWLEDKADDFEEEWHDHYYFEDGEVEVSYACEEI